MDYIIIYKKINSFKCLLCRVVRNIGIDICKDRNINAYTLSTTPLIRSIAILSTLFGRWYKSSLNT